MLIYFVAAFWCISVHFKHCSAGIRLLQQFDPISSVVDIIIYDIIQCTAERVHNIHAPITADSSSHSAIYGYSCAASSLHVKSYKVLLEP
jgi:hypothetical protein